MIERPVGAVNAAARPLMNRVRISSGPLVTSAPRSEAMAKTASAIRKTLRRPSRSAVRPPRSSRPPYRGGGPPPEKHSPAVPEDVAADQPLQGGRGQVQVCADGRQRDADHRD